MGVLTTNPEWLSNDQVWAIVRQLDQLTGDAHTEITRRYHREHEIHQQAASALVAARVDSVHTPGASFAAWIFNVARGDYNPPDSPLSGTPTVLALERQLRQLTARVKAELEGRYLLEFQLHTEAARVVNATLVGSRHYPTATFEEWLAHVANNDFHKRR